MGPATNEWDEDGGCISMGLGDALPHEKALMAALRPAVEACFDRLVAEFGLMLDEPETTAPLVGMIVQSTPELAARISRELREAP